MTTPQRIVNPPVIEQIRQLLVDIKSKEHKIIKLINTTNHPQILHSQQQIQQTASDTKAANELNQAGVELDSTTSSDATKSSSLSLAQQRHHMLLHHALQSEFKQYQQLKQQLLLLYNPSKQSIEQQEQQLEYTSIMNTNINIKLLQQSCQELTLWN